MCCILRGLKGVLEEVGKEVEQGGKDAFGERVISGEWKYKGVKYFNGGKDEILGMRLKDSHSGEWVFPSLDKL